ncbi:hypothetical protein Daus18300_006018 [Diaporthe australafricana]|uniref:Uncharacterized protein n=1 Tax=Diaporthe australafricana TaxID=127596 RepID=A0ABR3WY86_9PEZI
MRAPVLCAVAVISLCLAGVLEFLAQKSQKEGGLALSSSMDEIPESVNIAYLYMPTTVAVLYSLLWTWIDLDVRRMQPWLELSRSHGASAEQSLLLNYPFEFLAFVPIKAWKQRHWPVFITGSVMMLIFWAITPLQGAIFGKQAVTVSRSAGMSFSAGFIPVAEQAAVLDASVLNAAYGMAWYEQELPEYATTDYALLPFSPINNASLGADETWTVNTTKFATNLDCWPSTVTTTIEAVQGGQYLFDNSQGCVQNISVSGGKEGSYNMQYIGYKGDARLDWHLANSECKSEFSHQFLAIVGQGSGTGVNATFANITAMFCEPSYTQQEVSITVDATTGRPLDKSLVELAAPSPLDNTTFNSSAFEFLLHAGFSSVVVPRDYPDNLVLNQYARLYKSNVSWPTTNMVGFAVGLQNGTMADFLNTTVIQQSYAAAHKLIFSSAITQLVSQDAAQLTRNGVVEYTAYGIIVSRPFSIAVETLLAVVAVLAVALLFAIVRSNSNLVSDPDSIASLFGKIQDQASLLSHLSVKDKLNEKSFHASIRNDRYHLENRDDADGPALQLLSSQMTPANGNNTGTTTIVSLTSNESIRPKELRTSVGIVFLLALAAAISVLAYLKHQELFLHGLTRPSQNFEVLQLLENYIPMVFSTMLEPFLTMLNRMICALQPYQDLLKGRRSAKTTIETKYETLPPQLVLWRAAKAGHYILVLLSLVVLLANVLAVGLGAIFDESSTSVFTSLNVTSLISPSLTRATVLPNGASTLSNSPYSDHFYMVQTNLSANTRLPAWIDTKFAYLPFADLGSKDNTSAQYNAVTRGIGIAATCSVLSMNNASLTHGVYRFNVTTDLGNQEFALVHKDTPSGNSTKCEPAMYIPYSEPQGRSAQELYTSLQQPSDSDQTEEASTFCESRMLLGWLRYDTAQPKRAPSSAFLACTTEMITAQFNITVDSAGRVIESHRTGQYDDITEVLGPNATSVLRSANILIGDRSRQSTGGVSMLAWHNDTLTRDWMNYYLKLETNSTDYVDPSKDLPDVASLIPSVETNYQRLGAALLGANPDLFASFGPGRTPPRLAATIVTQNTRIFMDNTAFTISMTILGIYLLVGIMLYARQRRILLPRMPSTIGSAVAFVAGSRAVKMYSGSEKKGQPAEKYSFGRYVGADGTAHLGIELDPYVVLLDPKSTSLGGGKRRWGSNV